MPITYNVAENRVYVEYLAGDTKGDSIANAYTIHDIYLASVANGWNLIQVSDKAYYINCLLRGIGINTCFKSEYEIWYWSYPFTSNNAMWFAGIKELRLYYSTFRSQPLNNYNYIRVNSPGLIEGCTFHGKFVAYWGAAGIGTVLRDVNFIDCYACYPSGVFEMDNVQFLRLSAAFSTYSAFQNDGLRFIDCATVLDTYVNPLQTTFRNIKSRNITNSISLRTFGNSIRNIHLIDCDLDLDTTKISIYSTSGTDTIYGKSTFRYLFGSADIVIRDKDGNIVLERSVINNDSDEVTYHKRVFSTLDGVILENTVTKPQPFKLSISKAGYDTLEIPDIYVTSGQPTIIRAALVPVTLPVYIDATITVEALPVPTATVSVIETETVNVTILEPETIEVEIG